MIPLADIPAPVLKFVVGFWRRKWIVLAVAWALAVPGWLVVAALPDSYTSHAKIHVQTESMTDQVFKNIAPRPDFQNRVDLLRLRLLTRPNVEKVARSIGLDLETRNQLEYERALVDLVEGVKVRAQRNNYFEIRYTGDDPVKAQQVVNGFLNIFIESDLSSTLSGLDNARAAIDRQIANFDAQINEQQRRIAQYRRQYSAELSRPDRLAQDIARMNDTLEGYESELNALAPQRTAIEERLAGTPRAAKETDPEILRLKELLLDLQARYTDDYPRIVALKERIAELSGRLDRAGAVNPEYERLQRTAEFLDKAVVDLETKRDALRDQISESQSALSLAPEAMVELDDIARGLENLKSKRRTLEDQRLALEISAGVGDSGEQVIYQVDERPLVPLEPTGPPRLIFTAVVLVVAIGGGAAAAFGLILLDRSFTQADELTAAYGLPVLGAVSIVSATLATPRRLRELGLFAAGFGGLFLIAATISFVYVTRGPVQVAGALDKPVVSQSG
ncbi:MAG: XrtA system polysaccharide chain length determinant [Pseudomonadota bacterium]